MDKEYRTRIEYRKRLLKEHPDVVRALDIGPSTDNPDPRIRPALSELYTWVMGTYLPGRYPSMFQLKATEYETGKTDMLHNKVTGTLYPTKISSGSPTDTGPLYLALETLGKTVDEDFLILLPTRSPEEKNNPEPSTPPHLANNDPTDPNRTYTLAAYINCYPNGFNPASKIGKQLSDIHTPVPGYAARLEKSMDRFFRSIPVGKYVLRANWSVVVGAPLFAAFGGTHAYEEDTEAEEEGWSAARDLDQTVLRVERQTLHRLPKSKALVFAFHSYEYPLRDIKENEPENAERLAIASEGLKMGNVPEMEGYKRGKIWGPGVREYLRG